MPSIESNPFTYKPEGKREPYEDLVGKMLGPEAQAAALRLKERKADSYEITEDEFSPVGTSESTEQEKLIAEAARFEFKARAAFKEAGSVISKIEADVTREGALLSLVTHLAEAGRFGAAKETALEIHALEIRSPAFVEIASSMRQFGLDPTEAFKQAEADALNAKDNILRASAIKRLISARCERPASMPYEVLRVTELVVVERFEEAEKTALGIWDVNLRITQLLSIASALIMASRDGSKIFNEARKAVDEIPQEHDRARALSEIAVAYVGAGRSWTECFEEAEEAAEAVDDKSRRGSAYSDLALAYAQASKILKDRAAKE